MRARLLRCPPTACSSKTPSERHRLTGLFSMLTAPGPSDTPSKTANDFFTSLTKCAKPEISGLFTAIISTRLVVAPAVTERSADRHSAEWHRAHPGPPRRAQTQPT